MSIRFGSSDLPPFLRGQKWGPWKGEADEGATVWLGPPLLRWTLDQLVDQDWAARTHEILKRFTALARLELELLSFGQCSVLDWSTNDLASIASQSGMMKSHPDDLASLAGRCAPSLRALMLQALSMLGDTGNPLMRSLLTLAAALRDRGVEIDPDNLFGKLFFALRQQPDKDETPSTT